MTDEIHPTALVEGGVELGDGVTVGPYSVITGPVTVGPNTHIGSHVVIGGFGDEIRGRRGDASARSIQIGHDCLIREFVSIHRPCYGDETVIGNGVYLMHGSYVAHDSRIGDRAILAQLSAIGGVSRILEGAYVAMGAAVVQRVVIGHYSIVAAASAAVQNVRPFTRSIPGRGAEVNAYAVDRYGFDHERPEIERYVSEGRVPASGRVRQMVEEYESVCAEPTPPEL